jgi:two-component system, OmpR family, phosphate regulon response regulator PhoB
MGKFLLVEDDASLGSTLQERLQKKSFEVVWARTFAAAHASLKNDHFDLIILDVGLPDGSGFDLAREIKGRSTVPIIFLTAMTAAHYRLQGFQIGAEEYIPKPFHLQELFLRIDHVLQNHAAKRRLKCGTRLIDFDSMTITSENGASEGLSVKEAQVLELLIKTSPKVISRDEILDAVWGEDKSPTNRTVDNIIVRLRNLLGDDGTIIKSVRSVGYQWLGEKGKD